MKAHPERANGPTLGTNDPAAGAGIVLLLERLRRKVRNILLVRGVFLAAGIALITLLAAIGTDALFAPEAMVLRWALTLSLLAVTLVAVVLLLIRPILERVSVDEIARVLEVRHPELKERLSNALDIIRRRKAGDVNLSVFSDELLANTLRDAERSAEQICPAREFVHHNWWKYGIATAAPIVAVCLLAMFFPDQLGRLLSRVLNPSSERGNVYASRMTITPGDAWVREGDPLIIVVETEHLDTDRAELVRKQLNPGGEVTREAMSLVEQDRDSGKSRFMIKFPTVTEEFNYQVNSGLGSSENFSIKVRKWPKLDSLKVRFDYPEYTRLETQTIEHAGESLSAPIGTEVSFEAEFSDLLETAELRLPGTALADTAIDGRRALSQFEMTPGLNGTWSYSASNQTDMQVETDPGEIRAVADAPPMVRLFEPQYDRVVAKADGKVNFRFEVFDDFGIADCSLELMSDDGKRESTPLQVETEGEHEYDLRKMVGEKTRRLIAFIRVKDTRPDQFGGTQMSDSRPVVIDIDHTDGPLEDPMEGGEAAGLIEQALAALKPAHRQSEKMLAGLRQADRWLANEKLLAQLEANIASADVALEALAQELDAQQQPSYSEKIRGINSENVKPAGRAAQQIPSQPQSRISNARTVEENLAEAIATLQSMLLPYESLPQFADSPLAQLASLRQLQKQLAFEAAELAKQDPGKPMDEDWLRKQLELAQAMKQALVKKQGGPP